MSNSIQNDFEKLIKTLTTEISKEVLLEDMKTIRKSFAETQELYNKTYVGYTSEVNNMKKNILDFGAYTNKATMHTEELEALNESHRLMTLKMSEVLKELNESKLAVLEKILENNGILFENFKKKVAQLNAEEEARFLKAIENQLTQAEEKVSSLNEDIRSVVVKIDYNREKVLEEILEKNASFAEAYQKNIADFNQKETQLFLNHLDQSVMKRVDSTETMLKILVSDYSTEMNRLLQIQQEEMVQLAKTIKKGNAENNYEFKRVISDLEQFKKQFIETQMKQQREQLLFQDKVKKEISSLPEVMDTMRTKISSDMEKSNYDINQHIQALRNEMKEQQSQQNLWLTIGGLILFVILYFKK